MLLNHNSVCGGSVDDELETGVGSGCSLECSSLLSFSSVCDTSPAASGPLPSNSSFSSPSPPTASVSSYSVILSLPVFFTFFDFLVFFFLSSVGASVGAGVGGGVNFSLLIKYLTSRSKADVFSRT